MGKCWALHQGSQVAQGSGSSCRRRYTPPPRGRRRGADEARRRGVPVLARSPPRSCPRCGSGGAAGRVHRHRRGHAHRPGEQPIRPPGRRRQRAVPAGATRRLRRARRARGDLGEIAEDAAFARRAEELRQGYWLGDGRELATTRMYTAPGALWEDGRRTCMAAPGCSPGSSHCWARRDLAADAGGAVRQPVLAWRGRSISLPAPG